MLELSADLLGGCRVRLVACQVCVEIFKEKGHAVDYKVGLPKDEVRRKRAD